MTAPPSAVSVVLPPRVYAQHRRQLDRAIGVLTVLKTADQAAPDRQTRAVERVHELRLRHCPRGGTARSSAGPENRRWSTRWRSRDRRPARAARPRCHRRAAPRSPLRGHPRCGRAGPSRSSRSSDSTHSVLFGVAGLGVGDRDHLDLLELVLAQHAGRVLAGAAGFRAETQRLRRHPDRQLALLQRLRPPPASLPRSGSATSHW